MFSPPQGKKNSKIYTPAFIHKHLQDINTQNLFWSFPHKEKYRLLTYIYVVSWAPAYITNFTPLPYPTGKNI